MENPTRKGAELGRDEQLMRQILYADCELYMALLTFLKQGKMCKSKAPVSHPVKNKGNHCKAILQ